MTPEQLKASILQRAMEGKLVPQNPNDEPASELLKRIKAEKEKLISEGKIKRDKDVVYYSSLNLLWLQIYLSKKYLQMCNFEACKS